MDSFYSTVTTFCFTLLGLWWGVVQFRHKEWMNDPLKRRMANGVYLAFLVPGITSLGAQIAPDVRGMWNLVFIVGSIGGFIAQLVMMRARQAKLGNGFFSNFGRWLAMGLYIFIFLTALFPTAYSAVGLTGLQGEALWVTLLVFLSVMLAWEGLTAPDLDTKFPQL